MSRWVRDASRFLSALALCAGVALLVPRAALAQEEQHGTAAAGHEEHGGEFDIQEYIGHHLTDSRTLDFTPFGEIHLPAFHVGPFDLSITKHVVFVWLAGALMLAIFIPMARSRATVRRGLHNFMEALVVYVRDQVAVANIGKEKAGPFVPYLLTLFFFILFANLLGLLPFGATATSNWMVTGALALLTMVVAEGSSLKHLGVRGYVRQFLPIQMDSKSIVGKLLGLVLVGLIFVIEAISHISRIVALTVRLAANMTAGHLLIFALIGMIFLFKSYAVAPVSVGFSAAVYLLEIFIALLQAFIFTLLTALFIGMAVQEHH
ncbi:MAG TPA: F0F1 ATP synthase subunit A [Gemmatimonadota bacterium]|jgi:F-type H+-transporting ATPase subunit a